MTKLMGDSGIASLGPLKSFAITPGPANEYPISQIVLPTSEPIEAQISYTVTEADLCTIEPDVIMKNMGVIVCSGKAPTIATISYRTLINGSSVVQSNGSATTQANDFWTYTFPVGEVQVGDVLEVKFWSNKDDTYLDYYATFLAPSQPEVSKRGAILKDLSIINQVGTQVLSLGNMSNAVNCFIYPTNTTAALSTSTFSISAIALNSDYGFFRNTQGDTAKNTYFQRSPTTRNYQRFSYPSSFSFREINL